MKHSVSLALLLVCFVSLDAVADPPNVDAGPVTGIAVAAPSPFEVPPAGSRLADPAMFWVESTIADLAGPCASLEDSPKVKLENGRIGTSDGYAVTPRVLIDNEAITVISVTAESPDGRRAVGMMRVMKASGYAQRDGMKAVAALLGESEEWRVIALLPECRHASSGAIGDPEKGSASGNRASALVETTSCELAQYALAVAVVRMTYDCGTDNGAGCIFDIAALMGTLANVINQCGGVIDVCGAECPKVEEPPACTSYTIC